MAAVDGKKPKQRDEFESYEPYASFVEQLPNWDPFNLSFRRQRQGREQWATIISLVFETATHGGDNRCCWM